MTQQGSDFGAKLKHLRKQLGKSQMEMAKEINDSFLGRIRMSQTTLSNLEQRTTLPGPTVVEVLAQYLGVPVSDFYHGTSPEARIARARRYLDRLRYGSFERPEQIAYDEDTEYLASL